MKRAPLGTPRASLDIYLPAVLEAQTFAATRLTMLGFENFTWVPRATAITGVLAVSIA